MFTIKDCIGLSGLTENEVDAIAAHEHVAEIVAAELGCCLETTIEGQHRILEMIDDDIVVERAAGHRSRAAALQVTRHEYLSHHPET